MVNLVLEHKIHFVFVAKPDDHQYMIQWLVEYEALTELSVSDSEGRKHRYTYQNKVPLSAKKDAPRVNYIHYELINKKGKRTYTNSWVTDIVIDKQNVARLAKAGRCRWKIESVPQAHKKAA